MDALRKRGARTADLAAAQNQPPLGRVLRLFRQALPLAGFFFRLLPLVVMPLDGEEHAGAEHEHLEGDEDYRDPIHLERLSGC